MPTHRFPTSEVTEILRRIDLFQDFGDLQALAEPSPQIELEDRQVLMERDDEGSSMYVILDGQVDIYIKDRLIRTIGRGEYLGELALLESGRRSASARASGVALVLEITRDLFEKHVRMRPEAMLAVARKLTRRLQDTISRTQSSYEHVNMMVHDLLNMVTVFESADIVKDMLPADHEGQTFLGYILKASGELTGLMHGSLRSFRGIASTYDKRPEQIDELVRECLARDLALHADVRRAHVELLVEAKPAPVTCNGLDIRRVVCNLIINAAQAAGENARIVVSVREDSRMVVVTVADNGPGIPAHVRDKLFESQFTTKANGNGIGLSSCRYIVERLHGGHLTFQSEVGKGTSFFCELPR